VLRADEWDGTLAELLKNHRYQRELTAYLDGLGFELFAQDVVNAIVLLPFD
jgi:hypothetical protein